MKYPAKSRFPDLANLSSGHIPSRTRINRGFRSILILAFAASFAVIYANTFRGYPIHRLTHGPFNFECGVYRSYADGEKDLRVTTDSKLTKHLLCAVVYPYLYRLLLVYFPAKESPLVCSFLSGLMLAIFGFWLYRKTRRVFIVLFIILLAGFSFTTWYDGSVWESRAFISFCSVILLVLLDWMSRAPSLLSTIGCSLALVFLLLTSLGNAYLLPLLPLAVMMRSRQIGWANSIYLSCISVIVVVAAVAIIYQTGGILLNPQLRLSEVAKLLWQEKTDIQASTARFTPANYGRVALQALVSSVGGLRLPTGYGIHPGNEVWTVAGSYLEYFRRLWGIFFAVTYTAVFAVVIISVIKYSLILKEPLIVLIACWIGLYISFFVYFNPDAGPVYAAELMAPLWAFVALALLPLSAAKMLTLLAAFTVSVALNNWTVIQFFKDFNHDPNLLTTRVDRVGSAYQAWAWEVKPGAIKSKRLKVEAAHSLPGPSAGFWLAAWIDNDKDGIPDQEIVRSTFMTSRSAADVSGFEFDAPPGKVFVGMAWRSEDNPWLFFSADQFPAVSLLENQAYYQQSNGIFKTFSPTVTNLWVSSPSE